VIRFATVRELRGEPDGARIALSATDGTPLAIERLERKADQGRVMLLTFGLELDRGNIARCRAFPALMARFVQYLAGQDKVRPPDVLPAGEMRVLDVSEVPFAHETVLDLSRMEAGEKAAPDTQRAPGADGDAGRQRALIAQLPIGPERQVVLPGLPAGRYLIHKSQGAGAGAQVLSYARPLTVNADPRESQMAQIAGTELQALFGPETRIVSPEHLPELVPHGGEFWTILVLLLFAAYAAEAVAGWIACVRRERQRAAEGAA